MKVAVRIRPLKNSEVKSEVKLEGKSNLSSILQVTDGNLIFDPIDAKKGFYFHGKKQLHRDITIVNKNLSFKFDDIFDADAQNRDVFEKLMKPLVHSLMDGSNCSFINYGATATGKTHTIIGNIGQRGIAYLTMEYIFFQLNKRVSSDWIYDVSVSYLEVYNEKIINLLAKSKSPLTITQRSNGDMNVLGLSMRKVNNLSEVQKLLTLGNRNRTKHFTKTTHSTQSNTIFQININTPNKSVNGNSSSDSTVQLLIVELGGSERTLTEGTRPNATEIANISKPILTLKNCLHRLADGSKMVPFNESQLTKILKRSFGSSCLTVMLFNVCPSTTSYTDTYNTLTYANRAKQIGKSSEKQSENAVVDHALIVNTGPVLKRNTSYTISYSKPEANKSVFTESARKIKSSKVKYEPKPKEIVQRFGSSSGMNTELTELTRWYYEISTIYDAVKTAVEGYCTSASKEKLMELRLRCRDDVDNCRSLLLSGGLAGGSNRMAKVRVKSLLDEITKQSNITPNKVNYWKSRLQICQQQLQNLHRKVKESNLDHILESYISMKEFEVNATKVYHESIHIMKTNAIYVSITEIYGYLSVLGVNFDATDRVYNAERSELNEIAEIDLPLYKNYVAGTSSKPNSQTKCNKVDSRTSISNNK